MIVLAEKDDELQTVTKRLHHLKREIDSFRKQLRMSWNIDQ